MEAQVNTTDSILIGVIVGVTAGLVVSSIQAAVLFVRRLVERHDQVKTLRVHIANFRNQILEAKSFESDLGGNSATFPVDELRKAIFDDMCRGLRTMLEGRATRLSFDEKHQILNAVFLYSHLFPQVRPNIQAYGKIFDEFESLDWLKFPPRQQ